MSPEPLIVNYGIPVPEHLLNVKSWVLSAGPNFPSPPWNRGQAFKVIIRVRPGALPKLPPIPGWPVPNPTSYQFQGSSTAIEEGRTEEFVGLWQHPGQSKGILRTLNNKPHGVVSFKDGFEFLIPQDKMHRILPQTDPELTDPPNSVFPGLFDFPSVPS